MQIPLSASFVNCNSPISLTLFLEFVTLHSTLTPSNSRLKAIGGDYDGDTVKSVGIWSDEANEEATRLMYSKIYCIKPEATTPFTIEIECLGGLFALTKGALQDEEKK